MEQVARAMEMFAIAHEYGHHHLGHGRNVEADPKLQEFEADQFALKICDEADRKPVIIDNPYLISGAGGAVLLKFMNLLRVHEKLFGAKNVDFDTHPNVIDRVNRFDSVRILKPKEFEWLKSFRDVSVRIMDAVSEILLRPLDDMSKTDLAGIRDLRQKMLGD